MKIAIIGAGISGLSMANILKSKHQVVVFDKGAKAGGQIKCDDVDSVLFHKVGGHVFNSKNKAVLDWFWSNFDRDNEFTQVKRNAKIFIQNKIVGYPIENYLYNLDKGTVEGIIKELLASKDDATKSALDYDNFEEFLKSNFGTGLYNLYFKPYNKKIWNTDLSTVPLPWLDGKLPMPNLESMILSNIVREEESEMVHSTFYYPKVKGSQFIVDRLAQGLDIRLDSDISHIEKTAEGYTIEGESGFDSIVYCGDVRKLPDYMHQLVSAKVDMAKLTQLRTNGTSNMLCSTDTNDLSWLYIPEDFTRAHRIIYTGNFAESNNGKSDRKTCVVEFSGKVSEDVILSELAKLPGNLKPIKANYEPNSYVIHSKDTSQLIEGAKSALEPEKIHLLGRFAEWEYYNMDKCMEAAMALAEKHF